MTKNNQDFQARISHSLAIKAEKLIGQLGFFSKILFVSDKKIWQNCCEFFASDFLDFVSASLIFNDVKADEKNLNKILSKAESQKFDLIIALGSGTINDLCKLVSARKKIPYIVFASAPSMNGYFSRNASITIHGHKKTVAATLPKAVFCDLGILSKAPTELAKAGLGDAMCFYSCWFDWYLSHLILGTKFDKKPFKILAKKMDFLVKNFSKFSLKDEKFLKILIEILLLSGQGMTIAEGSYPASQSEHLIAHTIEMKYPQKLKNIFHGQQIAVTTLTSAKLQKKLLKQNALTLSLSKGEDMLRQAQHDVNLENFFGKKIAAECKKEFSQKILTAAETYKINRSLEKDWPKIKSQLQKIYFDEASLRKIFSHFKIKTSISSLGLSSKEYQDCVSFAKFIRNRFTCLDLVR
jgi:glycerol-1-phosphate dehydrogenase [NAD(P)+]